MTRIKHSKEPLIAKIVLPTHDVHVFELHSPYDVEFITKLKARVPGKKRKFVWTNGKFWVIDIHYIEAVKKLCRGFYDDVVVYRGEDILAEQEFTDQVNESHANIGQASGWKAAEVFILHAPEEALKTMYRETAKILHPDQGGSDEKMRNLKEAWEEIKAVRGFQ